MAGSVNKVILVGNLGADPEIRRLNSGDPVVNFSIATSENWRDKNSGERKEKTEWHNVVVFNDNLVKVVEQYLKKGMKVYVEGQLQTRKWQDQSGQDRYTTKVVLQKFRGELQMLDARGQGGEGGQVSHGGGGELLEFRRTAFPNEDNGRSSGNRGGGRRLWRRRWRLSRPGRRDSFRSRPEQICKVGESRCCFSTPFFF